MAEKRVAARELWRGRAFGLDVETPFPLPWLGPANGPSRRATSVEVATLAEAERLWRPNESVRVLDRRFPDGRSMLTVERHEQLGYRIWWPGHGRYLVSSDGTRVVAALPELAPWRWQKFIFAVVLPLAAKLQGLEVLHASAVAFGETALGFVAASGIGKSSVAAHLVARGASFVSDDVIALERTDEGVLAHPGPRVASVRDSELRQMTAAGRKRLGEVIGRNDKVQLAARYTIHRPLRLRAIYFLGRDRSAARVQVAAVSPPDPRLVLASTFVAYANGSATLVNQLDVSARLTAEVGLYRVWLPNGLAASDVARAIEDHAGSIR